MMQRRSEPAGVRRKRATKLTQESQERGTGVARGRLRVTRNRLRIRLLRIVDYVRDWRTRVEVRFEHGRPLALRDATSLPPESPRHHENLVEGAPVPIFWSPGPNMGDALSPIIVAACLEVSLVPVSRRFRGKLLAVGSILEFVRPGDVVLGTGQIAAQPVNALGARILATRGPLTESLIRNADVPGVYGDLVQLLPDIYRPKGRRTGRIAVVPHYVDRDRMQVDDASIDVVDVLASPPLDQVDKIANADAVISSSLHGLIIAEAYGVPAVWVQPSQDVIGGRFKFSDYFAATDRDGSPASWSPDLRCLSLAVPPPVFYLEPLRAAVKSFLNIFPERVPTTTSRLARNERARRRKIQPDAEN